MRIMHVITRLIVGGAQENTLLTVDGLHHRYGDNVILITGPAEGPEGDLFEQAAERGLKIVLMPELIRAIRPTTDLRAYRLLRKAIGRFQPDVVHTHSSKAGILGRGTAWDEHVPAIVHTIHGLPFGPSESAAKNALYVWLERWAARRCHAIVSVCDSMTEQALAVKVGRSEQYSTVYSGMDVESFLNPSRSREEVRHELGLADQDIAFATVARLFERKGHDDILAAASAVLQENPNVRFLFIGDGLYRDRLREEAARLGVAHAIQFVGLVAPRRIPELLQAVDAIVHPSLREGLARVLPQSLLVGRPVISYDVDGAKEVVRPDTGILVPPRSIDGLIGGILRLAANPELRTAMGLAGRASFTHQFRHETMTDELRSLYQRLLKGTSSQSGIARP